jgi:hypothetical protein
MTEEEAKTKWCPMVRHTKDNEGAFYTTNGQSSKSFQWCIASDCMMWRWYERISNNNLNTKDQQEKIKGYCGLAGKYGGL